MYCTVMPTQSTVNLKMDDMIDKESADTTNSSRHFHIYHILVSLSG